MNELSGNLAARRAQLGISQGALAELVGVHQTMISAIERGEKSPSLDLLLRLQDALGVTLIPAPPLRASEAAVHL